VNNVHQKESQCFGLSGFAIPSNVDIPNSSLGFNTNQSASHVPLSCHRPASERIPLLVVTLVTKIQLYKVIIWLARIRYHHHPISILLWSIRKILTKFGRSCLNAKMLLLRPCWTVRNFKVSQVVILIVCFNYFLHLMCFFLFCGFLNAFTHLVYYFHNVSEMTILVESMINLVAESQSLYLVLVLIKALFKTFLMMWLSLIVLWIQVWVVASVMLLKTLFFLKMTLTLFQIPFHLKLDLYVIRRVLLLDLPRTCLRSVKVHLLNIMLVLLWIPMLCTFSNPLRFKCWKKLLYFKDFVIWLEDLMKCTTRSSVQLQVLLILHLVLLLLLFMVIVQKNLHIPWLVISIEILPQVVRCQFMDQEEL